MTPLVNRSTHIPIEFIGHSRHSKNSGTYEAFALRHLQYGNSFKRIVPGGQSWQTFLTLS